MIEHVMRIGDKAWDKVKGNGVIRKIIPEHDTGLHEVMIVWQDGTWSMHDKDDMDNKYKNETFGYILED